jgi:hypothetical protein
VLSLNGATFRSIKLEAHQLYNSYTSAAKKASFGLRCLCRAGDDDGVSPIRDCSPVPASASVFLLAEDGLFAGEHEAFVEGGFD